MYQKDNIDDLDKGVEAKSDVVKNYNNISNNDTEQLENKTNIDNDVSDSAQLSKKEKAESAGRDVAEVAARGAARYYGGELGGAATDVALQTKFGQKALDRTSKKINKNPVIRNGLAKNQERISEAKPVANSLIDNMSAVNGGASDTGGNNISGGNTGGNSIGGNNTGIDNTSNNDFGNNVNDKTESNSLGKNKINLAKDGLSGAFKKLPLKVKLIIIGVIISFAITLFFIAILCGTLMSIGVIDITGMGGPTKNPSFSYSSVSGSITYWWPIGSSEITVKNGVTFASGEPSPSVIASKFGPRIHPITGELKTHTGIDISDNNPVGVTNIIAAQDGTVTYPSNNDAVNCPTSSAMDNCGGGYGNFVMIQHADGSVTLYAHLHENTITVRAGDTVKQGQVIGKMGSSGNSTGSHLHFEVRQGGNAVNPSNFVNLEDTRPKGKANTGNYTPGDSNQQSVCLTLKTAGFSDNAVAALLTNINSESSFNPTVIGDNGTSYGLCQWHNGRYDNLRTTYPDSYHTIGSQIDYLIYELQNKYLDVYNALVDNSQSASDLTYKFCANFEIPYDTKNTCENRANGTNTYYQYVVNGCK